MRARVATNESGAKVSWGFKITRKEKKITSPNQRAKSHQSRR